MHQQHLNLIFNGLLVLSCKTDVFAIGRVSFLIYVSMRHYVLTTSGDIIVCFHTAVCLSC